MSNRLALEDSPYLQQHKDNPIEWYPWCDEAFEKASSEHKSIFISIGYSSCHWCHVMEHEVFENSEIAEFVNHHFVCIKVDREERPDIDKHYQELHNLLNRRAGRMASLYLSVLLKTNRFMPPPTSLRSIANG
jgi:uncharacterized protein